MINIFENKHHLKNNWVGYTAGLIAIGGLIAQIEITYRRKSAGDVSYILIGSRIIILLLWLYYGYTNEIAPTIFSSVTGLILTTILLGLKIHYGDKKNDDNKTKTKYWGNQMWEMMHTYSYLYPKNPTNEMQENAKSFYESMYDIVKCEKCKKSIQDYIENNPIHNNNKNDLINWVLEFHNFVNKKLGKEEWTRKQLDENYL